MTRKARYYRTDALVEKRHGRSAVDETGKGFYQFLG